MTTAMEHLTNVVSRVRGAWRKKDYATALGVLHDARHELVIIEVRYLMGKHGLRQSDLARIWGINRSTVSNLLVGKNTISPSRLDELWRAVSKRRDASHS
ncbi:MAG: helix-turn-helix transcriptional regulator [Pseudomonadota bacterium]